MKRHKRHQINFQTVYISHLVKGTSGVMGTPKITCFLYGVNSNWLVHISKSHCKYTFHRTKSRKLKIYHLSHTFVYKLFKLRLTIMAKKVWHLRCFLTWLVVSFATRWSVPIAWWWAQRTHTRKEKNWTCDNFLFTYVHNTPGLWHG